jgi:hypothetical protein
MDGANDDLNPTQWAAAIGILVLLAVPLAVGLAWWCKRRYARAVVALQRGSAPAGAAPAPLAVPAAQAVGPSQAALRIDIGAVTEAAAGEAPPGLTAGRRMRRRVLIAQVVLGTLYWWSLLLAAAIALAAYAQATGQALDGDNDSGAWGHAFIWPLLLAAPLLAWAFQAGWRESRVWAGFGLAFAAMFAGMLATRTGAVESTVAIAAMAAVSAMPLAFMRPDFRGAGPPLTLALTGGMLVFWILGAIAAAFDDSDPNAPTTAADIVILVVGLAVMLAIGGWVAWRLLLRQARRYADKRFSDLGLAHDAYWALITAFTAAAVLMISFEESTGGSMEWVALGVLLLWWLWRAALRRLVRALVRSAPPGGPSLLLLRVFKPSARSESFMDRLLARWRFVGPAWMIAGPDLAGAFMEPDEFFTWLRRRLHERFIARTDEVGARLAALDVARDPDGRFRVSELFCADGTWQAAVLALMDRADVVLLDLREYTPQRAGTHFELVQLLRRSDLRRVRVLIDARDDAQAVATAIRNAWREAARPAAAEPAALALLTIGSGSEAELQALTQALAQAAQAPRAMPQH